MSYFTQDTKDLFDMGKFYVVVDFLAGPDAAYFQSAVIFIDDLALRGKNRLG